jgi:hypothetical protein
MNYLKRLILISLFLSLIVWARSFDLSVEDSLARINPQFRQEWLSERWITEPFYNQDLSLPDSQNVRCVGRWPFGPSFNIIGKDSIIFLGSGSGVRIISVSTPNNPRQISQIALPGSADEMAIQDSLLYIDFSWTGIEIYNINTPSSPIHINRFNNHIRDFFIRDSFCFAVSGDSFKIFNIKDPLNIIQLGGCADSGASVVSVSGNYAYTGNRGSMHVIDMTNPANPHIVNSWPGYIWAIANRNNLCYVMVGGSSSNAFKILDVTNPLNIQQLGTINNIAGYGICLKGFLAYLACSDATGGLPGLFIVDISDSLNPAIVGSIDPSGWEEDVFVFNNFSYVYLAGNWEGLQVIDATDPTQPSLDTLCFSADLALDVVVDGDYAYVADEQAGVKIIDVSNPNLPNQTGEFDTTTGPCMSAAAKDSFAYMGIWDFWVLDVSNHTHPTIIGRTSMFNWPEDIAIKDTLVYFAEDSKFQIYNVSNPRQPRLVGSCDLPDDAYGMCLNDTFAYIANQYAGLKIINIAQPNNPYVAGTFSLSGWTNGVFVKDTIAYVASLDIGLRIVNVKNPQSPFEISSVPTGQTYDVVVKDSFAYVGCAILKVINVSDPLYPFEVGHYTTPYRVRKIYVDTNYIYCTCFDAGMSILENMLTGIKEEENIQIFPVFTISPNPVFDRVVIRINNQQGSKYEIFMHDALGKLVVSKIMRFDRGSKEEALNISNLSDGVYFVTIRRDYQNKITKIVKIKGR